MIIGITGAFGFLGSNFTAHLIKMSKTTDVIVAFYSHTLENPVFSNSDITTRCIDIKNYTDVLEKTKDIDILFHFAGKVGYRKIDAKLLWETNVHGTINIFEASLKNRTKKIIYISSINVLGAAENKFSLANEKNNIYDPKAGNPNLISSQEMALSLVDKSLSGDFTFIENSKVPYFDSKLAALEIAKKYIKNNNLPVITVFPGTVVGPGDIHKDISELIERVYNNAMLFTFTGGTSFVDVRDCAQGIYLCMKNGSLQESYIISGIDKYNLSYKDFMKYIAKASALDNKKVRNWFIGIPHFIAIIVTTIVEFLNPKSPLSPALAHSGKMLHRFSSKNAMDKLGYTPNYNLIQSIRDCYKFLKERTKLFDDL